MEIPTITTEDIQTFYKLHAEFTALQDQASAAITAAQLVKDNEITIARNGTAVVLTEKDLWDEVWNLGADSDAGKILSDKYPEAFQLSKEAEEKKAAMALHAKSAWNIHPTKLTLSDIFRIAEAMIDYKLAQRL